MIRAFVFDLDGTLVETEELKALSYARAAVELRPDLSEGEVVAAFGDLVGLSRREVAIGLMRRFRLEDAAAREWPRSAWTRRGRPTYKSGSASTRRCSTTRI